MQSVAGADRERGPLRARGEGVKKEVAEVGKIEEKREETKREEMETSVRGKIRHT